MSKQCQAILLIVLALAFSAGCDNQLTGLETAYDSVASRYSTPSSNVAESAEASSPQDTESNTAIPTAPTAFSSSAAVSDPQMTINPQATNMQPVVQDSRISPRNTSVDRNTFPNGSQPDTEMLNRIRELEDQIANLNRKLQSRDQANQEISQDFVLENPPIVTANERESAAINPGIASYARKDLNRLIRRYERAKLAFRRSEESYKVDHFMTLVKGMEFLVRDTPQGFNTLPEKDKYAFRDFQEAADDLVPELEYYLADIANDAEKAELRPVLQEAKHVVEMLPTGTGNRLLDFLGTFDELAEEHQRQQQR